MDLKKIQAPIEKQLLETTEIIIKELKSSSNLLRKITNLTPISKGKKIRSTFLFLLAGLNKTKNSKLPIISASIEMLHLSSLIHDDIVDNSKLRRGVKTLNVNLGNYISVLGGDFLFIRSLNFLNRIEKKYLIDIVLIAASCMIEGQILEVDNNFNYDLSPKTYYTIVKKKTSALFAGIAEVIPALNEDSISRKKDFYQFGLNFGTMFQVRDDMLDIFSNNTGKDRFRDLKEGKITLPYIFLLKEKKEEVKRLIKSGNYKKLLALFHDFNIKEFCYQQINEYHQNCIDFLSDFPGSLYKDLLIELLEFTKSRDY